MIPTLYVYIYDVNFQLFGFANFQIYLIIINEPNLVLAPKVRTSYPWYSHMLITCMKKLVKKVTCQSLKLN